MCTNIKQLLKKNAQPGARGKHFIATFNNWDTKLSSFQDKALQFLYKRIKPQYLAGQAQVGGKQGTAHLQFYMYFPQKQTVGTLGKKFGIWCAVALDYHWVQNYCRKIQSRVGGPFYFGQKPGANKIIRAICGTGNFVQDQQLKKNAKIQKKLKKDQQWKVIKSSGVQGLIQSSFQHRASVYSVGALLKTQAWLKDLQSMRLSKLRVDQLQTHWFSQEKQRYLKFNLTNDKRRHYAISSPANFGKSTFFKDKPYAYFWVYDQNTQFQDNYNGQQFIIFDRWRPGNSCKFGSLQALTDKSPSIKRKNKGPLCPQRLTIIILTNLDDPFSVYYDQKIDKSIITSRFNFWNLPAKGVKPFLVQPEDQDSG